MSNSSLNSPKDTISLAFDSFGDKENYNTPLYLYKSKIVRGEGLNLLSVKLVVDLNQKPNNKCELADEYLNKDYGSFLITFLNADFSNPENAYNSFFIYYGIEALNFIYKIKEKFPTEYARRYTSTKNFLNYYNKAFSLVQEDYIQFQKDMRNAIDFVFNLHDIKTNDEIDKYSKFVAYSTSVGLFDEFSARINLSIMGGTIEDSISKKTLEEIEELALKISNKSIKRDFYYLYTSTSHFALAYIFLDHLIRNTNRSIGVCQNCGRYYLQKSGKEVYCELPNLDGSPSCKTYASRKAYDERITEDIAELTYKREYQRRITRVYRTNKEDKEKVSKEFQNWKKNARKQLKLYRDGKITQEDFCNWIEKNK